MASSAEPLEKNKPKLSVLFGQPDIYSTSFQTRQLAAALVPWFNLDYFRIPSAKGNLRRSLNRLAYNYIGPFFRRPRTDFLLYCNDGAADLAHWKGRRAIYWYDAPADWSQSPPRRRDWIQYLRCENIRRAEDVFVVSAAQVRVARALRPGREASVHYLPVGVDCRVFDPLKADPERVRAQFSLPRGKTIVGYLGYLGVYQGRFAGEILLDIAAELVQRADVHFLVVGFGPALQLWKDRVAQLGLSAQFSFTAYVADELVPHCIAAMDICIDTLEQGFHSEARSETKLKQYMAMGRACVATAIGENCVDLDGGRCGVLAQPGAGEVLKGVLSVCGKPEVRAELGRAARARAELVYDWRVLGAKMAAVLKSNT